MVVQPKASFEFDGEWLDQTEDYYLCRIATDAVATGGWNELEQRVFTAQRRLSVDELKETSEAVSPDDLAELLGELLVRSSVGSMRTVV